MQRFYLLILSVAICCSAVLSGCSMNEETPEAEEYITVDGQDVPSSAYVQDYVRVKFSQEMAEQLEIETDSDGNVTTKVPSVNNVIASLNIVGLERTFPFAGKFEKRTRKEGLHLWYNVVFAPETGLTKAGESLSGIEGIDIVEYRPKTIRYSGKVISRISSPEKNADDGQFLFNDPYLYSKQWHYYNNGSFNPSIAGADINVLPVWEKYTTGNKDVIVAVVDGGIDYTHEDLADNMWHNPEQTGNAIYGYNFVKSNYTLTADDHGTHVAGTVAAVNNNGIGVCGVAGGNKAAGIDGVKLMSCQIFEGKNGKDGAGATAIKWAADHGAVICQNSWGYDLRYTHKTPQSDKDAIDYFNKYAGMDENGNQTGPIAGGVVIFAAGNDSRNVGYPGDYEGCVAVASISSDFKAAYYTNYGSWVDVSAPGGDAYKEAQIYSTLPRNKYGEMQGTSMACPHVSGIAALIASKNAGKGYTGEQLKKALLESVVDITGYSGSIQIGNGLVNTYNAVVGKSTKAPNPIQDFTAHVDADRVSFSLTIPNDEDDGKPYHILIYASTSEINSDNYTSADAWSIRVGDTNAGEKMTGTFHVGKFNTTLYLSAVAVDASGLHSTSLSKNTKITTGSNNPPMVTPLDGTSVTLNAYEPKTLRFLAIDPDGHSVTTRTYPASNATNIHISQDTVKLTIDPKASKAGSYTVSLRVSDPYTTAEPVKVNYTIEENKAPVIIKELRDFAFKSEYAPTITIDGYEYFADPDNGPLTFKAIFNANGIAEATVEDNMISVRPLALGSIEMTIIATDHANKRVQTSSTVSVSQTSNPINTYPNPVVDIVKIQILENATLSSLSVRSNSGTYVFNETHIDVNPASPIEVDMSKFPAGIYTVTAKFEDGRTFKSNISKI